MVRVGVVAAVFTPPDMEHDDSRHHRFGRSGAYVRKRIDFPLAQSVSAAAFPSVDPEHYASQEAGKVSHRTDRGP